MERVPVVFRQAGDIAAEGHVEKNLYLSGGLRGVFVVGEPAAFAQIDENDACDDSGGEDGLICKSFKTNSYRLKEALAVQSRRHVGETELREPAGGGVCVEIAC